MCLLRVYLYTHRSPVIRLTAADRTARRFPANYNPTTDPVSSSLIILTSFFPYKTDANAHVENIFLLIFFSKRFYPTNLTTKIYRSRIRYMLKNIARKSRRFCTVFFKYFLHDAFLCFDVSHAEYSRIKLVLLFFFAFSLTLILFWVIFW